MQWINALHPENRVHLVYLYRIVSLSLTSFFFLFQFYQTSFILNLSIIVSLCIAAAIITGLIKKSLSNSKLIKSIVLIESFGLTLLLIPTGGISSPFIWYALNPVLVAASFLTPMFCWGVLTFFLVSSTVVTYFIFDLDKFLFYEYSYIYLVSLLSTFLVMLFSSLIKELDSTAIQLKTQQEQLLLVNKKLTDTNQDYIETLEHIMSLYYLMENFTSNPHLEKLTEVINCALKKCTQKESTFFWVMDLTTQQTYLSNATKNFDIEEELKHQWLSFKHLKDSRIINIKDIKFKIRVIHTSKILGVLGIEIQKIEEINNNSILLKRTFEFIANLSEILIEQIHYKEMKDQFMIIDEQNRIANEIHDSVSQKLFGIVYSLHTLKVKSTKMTIEELNEEYEFLAKTANSSIKELRAAIYKLSSVKKGEQFTIVLKNYLEEYAKLNNITINYEVSGDELPIPHKLKSELYRVICEACGNAVRHGQCRNIDIDLIYLTNGIKVSILDDGVGFKKDILKRKHNGLGLMNIDTIVQSFGGTFHMNSQVGIGTKITLSIPMINQKVKQIN